MLVCFNICSQKAVVFIGPEQVQFTSPVVPDKLRLGRSVTVDRTRSRLVSGISRTLSRSSTRSTTSSRASSTVCGPASTVHDTDRTGCSPDTPGKESNSLCTDLGLSSLQACALASMPWTVLPKLTYSLTPVNSLDIYYLLLGSVANRLVNSTLYCACLGLVDCPLAISSSGCLPGPDTEEQA